MKDQRLVHKLVKKTAQELAGAFYENAAHSNGFFRAWPSQKQFILSEWPKFVETTKKVFAQMLGGNTISEAEKAEIYEAMLADSTLPYSPKEIQIKSLPN